jgi:hypothetical protein
MRQSTLFQSTCVILAKDGVPEVALNHSVTAAKAQERAQQQQRIDYADGLARQNASAARESAKAARMAAWAALAAAAGAIAQLVVAIVGAVVK